MTVWVIDTSAIINSKRQVPRGRQWEFFERLKQMVIDGEVYFPRRVRDELHGGRHVDTPEAWALNVGPSVQLSYEPEDVTVAQVMAVAGDVVEEDAEDDTADPYVLAQALEIRAAGFDVLVVTDDHLDHPDKIAMTTACDRLGLGWIRLEDFINSIQF